MWQSTKYQRRIHPESPRVGGTCSGESLHLDGIFFPAFQRVMIWLINLAIPPEAAARAGRRRRAAASVISDHQAQPAAAAASLTL